MIGGIFEKEHGAIDHGIRGIINGANDLTALGKSLALLRAHIYNEEVTLFPALADRALRLTMVISMMEIEHGYMWPILIDLMNALKSAGPPEGYRDGCASLDQLLRLHNAREEQILYRATDRLLTEEDPATMPLIRAIATSKVPAGWKCSLAFT